MTADSQQGASADPAVPEETRLIHARVLTELGELDSAESETLALLEDQPELYGALSLLARIKHIRGELTQAFTLWAQLRALQPEAGNAQSRLAAILQLAQDPERGAGEFLAVGHSHLWRKPARMLELEQIFQLFVRRQPDEARGAALRLARKYHGTDVDLFKLARLAEAWVAELAGDLEGARDILEKLGLERGFEHDLDRALALARVYELLGSPHDLEKAVHVCQFLARSFRSFEGVVALGRLAALHRALGQSEQAAAQERAFLIAFQRHMHRVTRAEALAVADRVHLPLADLAAIRFVEDGAPAARTRRQRALARALAGDSAGAAELLAGKSDPLDLEYRADLALAAGDRSAALDLLLEAATRSSGEQRGEPRLLARLLDLSAPDLRERLAERFAPACSGDLALDYLERALRERPLSVRVWRRLAALHDLRGERPEAERCADHAEALAAARGRRERAIGRWLSAAVYRFAGSAKGLIHELWVDRRPVSRGGGQLVEVLGGANVELELSVRNVFVAVREYAQAKLPQSVRRLDRFNYALKFTKEDEPSHGLSAGLPIALAFLSAFLNRPLPQNAAASGALVADAHDVLVVRPVGDVEYKVRGAYNRSLRQLLLPAANRAALAASPMVPPAIVDELVRFVADLDEAVTLTFGVEIWTS